MLDPKVIIIAAGSREFADAGALESTLRSELDFCFRPALLINRPGDAVVFVGDCRTGADAIIREWCASRGVPCRVFEADWSAFGRAAGPRRNLQMISAAIDLARDCGLSASCLRGLFAFQPGATNRGTLNCRSLALASEFNCVDVYAGFSIPNKEETTVCQNQESLFQ
jgi:YspA, cpYpsA-related SLOG family